MIRFVPVSKRIVALPDHRVQEMSRLEHLVQDLNTELYNPVGLNIRWPRKVAFLFVSANCPRNTIFC
jgi:hypothetical protein